MEEDRIKYPVNTDVSIDDEPELIIIRDHISENYPNKDIYIFPYKNREGKVTANFYVNCRCMVSTSALGSVYVRRIRKRKELVSKLILIGKYIGS